MQSDGTWAPIVNAHICLPPPKDWKTVGSLVISKWPIASLEWKGQESNYFIFALQSASVAAAVTVSQKYCLLFLQIVSWTYA